MSDPMQEIMASFFVECEELHEALVDSLQAMSDGDSDAETINVAFRAVHSIKGGAAAFGLDDLVGFAHQFETVMDSCRSGVLAPDDRPIDLFFRCADMLSDLIRAARDGDDFDETARDALLSELSDRAGVTEDEPQPEIDFQPMTIDLGDFGPADLSPDLPQDGDPSPAPRTVIRFRPEPELYACGNEPLFLLRALADLGPCEVKLDFDPPDTLGDVRGGRLAWTVALETEAPASAIEEIFEFVDGLCKLTIGPLQDGMPEVPDISAIAATPDASDEGAQAPLPPLSLVEPADEPEQQPPASDAPPAPAEKTARRATSERKPAASGSGGASQTVRIDIDRVDRLVNLVGELVINQAMLSQSIAEEEIPSNSPVFNGLDEFLQLTRDIQESVMMIRAQPVKSLFQRMSRIVREASSAVGKTVRLVTEGETTEIDKTAIERLADPLTHMIRNAVDHGLETAEKRLAAGKPEQGEIRLSAAHRSGRVVIEVSDDGGGINREKVRDIAVSKGLIPADAALTDAEIDQLLFLPGFSTASEVSSLSGRGVGMDVVRTQITALGGRIAIESTPGAGTRFSISLPLTLAVLDGMVVTVAGEMLVVPLNAIIETVSLAGATVRLVSPGNCVLHARDRFVPLLDLGAELGYRHPQDPAAGEGVALLISPEDGTVAALVVDAIEDQRQVVIKGLHESYGRVPGVAAATILGDGRIALILDPSDLVQNAAGDTSLQKEAS